MADSTALRAASARLDALLQAIEADADRAAARRAGEVVELLMTLQRAALERTLELAGDPALGGDPLMNRIADDPVLGPLLVVHGLHPHAPATRLGRALERLRPRVAASGCRAVVVGVEADRARVRLDGGSRLPDDRRRALEEWLEASLLETVPELSAVAFEPDAQIDAPVPLIQILRTAPQP